MGRPGRPKRWKAPNPDRDLLTDIGFRVRSSEELTAEWAVLLKARLAMYEKLRLEAEAAGTPSGHDAFHKSYVRLVDLMSAHGLGGVRIVGGRHSACHVVRPKVKTAGSGAVQSAQG